jgi:hypothetical protein
MTEQRMKSIFANQLLVLLLGIGAASAHDYTWGPPTEFVLGVLFYAFLMVVTLTMAILAFCIRRQPTYEAENRPLIQTETPAPADSINVSSEYRNDVLSEVKSDEILVWAFEPSILNRRAVDAFAAGFLSSIGGIVFFVLASRWLFYLSVFCIISWISLFISGVYRFRRSDVKLYGITNKRIFMMVITPKFRAGREVLVHSSDYEGLQQMSMTRHEDGSGTITFSLSLLGSHPIKTNQYANPYAFENIPNVTQIKDLIESYKSAAHKV